MGEQGKKAQPGGRGGVEGALPWVGPVRVEQYPRYEVDSPMWHDLVNQHGETGREHVVARCWNSKYADAIAARLNAEAAPSGKVWIDADALEHMQGMEADRDVWRKRCERAEAGRDDALRALGRIKPITFYLGSPDQQWGRELWLACWMVGQTQRLMGQINDALHALGGVRLLPIDPSTFRGSTQFEVIYDNGDKSC